MAKHKAVLMKIATILLAISFFVETLTAIGMVFLTNFALKIGIFRLLVKVHTYNGFIFIALVLAHIYFNWGWVRVNILKR
jgi:hypothetical protein